MKDRPILLGFLVGSAVILVFFAVAMLVLTSFSSDFPSSIMGSDGIGIVNITSTITESRLILDQLDRYYNDDSIAAILLRIDSPGGAVGPSQEIHREIMKIRNDKVVVASLGSTAASGGYYVACAANKIMANPGTLTGSIGVIMEFINVRRLYEYVGMSSDVVKSGRFKDMGAWSRDLTKDERTLLQNVVDDVQKQFVAAIADGRGIDPENILSIADGRIFTGAQAMKYGLVDRLGNYHDSIDYAAELAGIEGKPRIVRQKERRISVWDIFLDDLVGQFAEKLQNALEQRDFRLR
jgi:protease IV